MSSIFSAFYFANLAQFAALVAIYLLLNTCMIGCIEPLRRLPPHCKPGKALALVD
jgi:hypothetical protein